LTPAAIGIGAQTPSARLRRKVGLASGPFADACTTLVRHPRLAELLPSYLVRTHWIIRATVPLMEDARARARDSNGDPVAAGVADYLARHIEEERGHDEWLLDDLEVLGIERETVVSGIPSDTVASLVGSQYYWIRHVHPVGLLGYIAVMEGYPPSPELVERLISASGHPREAFRTLAAHGELDPHHRDELDEAIDGLPITRSHEALLGLSAMTSVELLARSIEEILETG
jgi:hypothetical protein